MADATTRRALRRAVSRVRPSAWGLPQDGADLLQRVGARAPHADLETVARAYAFADQAHRGQTRLTGDAYVTHCAAVADILADYGADTETLVAALLHDTVEDTAVTLDDVEEAFGASVAALVDGVTKLDRVKAGTADQQQLRQQAGTLRKMITSMSRDPRVVVLKVADRLHNMRTVAPLPEPKRRRKALETLELYAPLAGRLGLHPVKRELEDLAFSVLHPDRYEHITHLLAKRAPQREKRLAQVTRELGAACEAAGVPAEVHGRPKHAWSVQQKIERRGVPFDEILDLIGARVVVESVEDCYRVLGLVHRLWTPVPGRFRDYIALPKGNNYQSLHTAVLGPESMPLEVQIRTREMHAHAEWGPAAHWRYKYGDDASSTAEPPAWMGRLADWGREWPLDRGDTAEEFLAAVRDEITTDDVVVFTPDGDAVSLPPGAYPLDFAYAIHTEVGHRCVGVVVNGRHEPLSRRLETGDVVEVLTTDEERYPGPTSDWLHVTVSQRARSRIRQHLRARDERDDQGAHPGAPDPNPEPHREDRATAPVTEAGPCRRADCCEPTPPDRVRAAVGSDGQATAHHADCPELADHPQGLVLPARWPDEDDGGAHTATVRVSAMDRADVLADIVSATSSAGGSVQSCQVTVPRAGAVEVWVDATVRATSLPALRRHLQAVDGVDEVELDGQTPR